MGATYKRRPKHGVEISFVKADIRDFNALENIFRTHKTDGIVHTAALKAVGECNATLPRGDILKAMTLECGLELLAGCRAWEAENGPSLKKAAKKATGKAKK